MLDELPRNDGKIWGLSDFEAYHRVLGRMRGDAAGRMLAFATHVAGSRHYICTVMLSVGLQAGTLIS